MTERVRESDGEIADAVRAMYAAYPEPARFDLHLHPAITIWETDQPGDRIGLPELTELRRRRRAVEPEPGGSSNAVPVLSVEDLLIDRWGDTAAVARYVLRATGTGEESAFRVTDVWDRAETWRIVHHHAEAL
ncbi:hypothetical protein [Nakamurella lactea]|uniref:hypothetical protein n=1 Tax=Nakamurella lactea TaxID=459515 RepID=UPI0003FAE4BE|nr:hypothetical protein [Nakamurella lactea]